MDANKSKMQLIKEFIETCPLLKDGKINVDYLDDEIDSYSLDQTPVVPCLKKFTDGGGGQYQIAFDFTVQAPISSRAIDNLVNSKFCEDFQYWILEQNRKKNLPKIKNAFSIECMTPRLYLTKNKDTGNLYHTIKI